METVNGTVRESTGNSQNVEAATGNDDKRAFPPLKSHPDSGTMGYGATGSTVGGKLSPTLPTLDNKFAFDFTFLRRFYALHRILFSSIFSATSAIFVFLLLLVLLQEYIVYQVGLISGGFYRTLGEKDQHGFWMHTLRSLGLILAVSFVNATADYIRKVLAVTFRKILSQHSHQLYFADIRFYQLNVLDKNIDNPDQRMTADIDKFCTTYCEVLPKLLVSPFTIGYYCYQGARRSGWLGPVGCFGFFLVATTVNKFLMSPVINYVVKQEKREGDFRFLHMLTRVHSESISFHYASWAEQRKVDDALQTLTDTQHSLYFRQYFLTYFINFVDYMGSIFSYLMIAIPIFTGEHDDLSPIDLTVLISENAFILMYLIFTFTSLLDVAGKFPDVAGVTHRIAQLLERLTTLEKHWKNIFPEDHNRITDIESFDGWIEKRKSIRERLQMQGGIEGEENKNDSVQTSGNAQSLLIWSLDNVTFSKPGTERPLVSNLDLKLVVGESVLISGPSSAGKSSLFRVLRGLWPVSSGQLKRHYPPGPHGVYFCPQKSYLTWGTLREQISFPLLPDTTRMDDKLLMHYLDKLKLTPVIERVGGLDVFTSWNIYDSLSPGEIQRVCLLRIFYHQPVVAILDEVTSALPLNMEEFVYTEMKRLGITLISVGHRESIAKYHDKRLVIDEGNWSVHSIER